MESYEVERIAEDVARRIGREIESQIDSVEREMGRELSILRGRLDEALSISEDLARTVNDLSRVVQAHQEAWSILGKAGQGL